MSRTKISFRLSHLFAVVAVAAIATKVGYHLHRGPQVEYTVVYDSDSKPAPGILIHVRNSEAGRVIKRRTDQNGNFRLAKAEDESPWRVFWVDDPDWAAVGYLPNQFEILRGEKIRLVRGSRLDLHVVDAETGTPAKSLSAIFSSQPNVRLDFQLDAQGRKQIRLPPCGIWFDTNISCDLDNGVTRRMSLGVCDDGTVIQYVRNPSNGHYYAKYQTSDRSYTITWDDAERICARIKHNGQPGHLVTITSRDESNFLRKTYSSPSPTTWLGASDRDEEGTWEWVCGPEAGQVFYKVGEKLDAFHNWDRKRSIRPTDRTVDDDKGRDHLAWNSYESTWFDRRADSTVSYVIIEFSKSDQQVSPVKAAQRVDSTNHPSQISVARFAWDDSLLVDGFHLQSGRWFTWESIPCVVYGALEMCHREDRVAIISTGNNDYPYSGSPEAWLLDLRKNKWSRLALPNDLSTRRMIFVGENLVALGSTKQRQLFVAIAKEDLSGWITIDRIPSERGKHNSIAGLVKSEERNELYIQVMHIKRYRDGRKEERTKSYHHYDLANKEWSDLDSPLNLSGAIGVWENQLISWQRVPDEERKHRYRLRSQSLSTFEQLLSDEKQLSWHPSLSVVVGNRMVVVDKEVDHKKEASKRMWTLKSLDMETFEWSTIPIDLTCDSRITRVHLVSDETLLLLGWKGKPQNRFALLLHLATLELVKVPAPPASTENVRRFTTSAFH